MTADIFSEARRTFEILPGAGTLKRAVGKLAEAGVTRSHIRDWALSISEEYGILSYVGPAFDHIMAGAVRTDQSRTAA